ncbi:hypothetical protein M9458_055001, partial [Cirrhinus mrigala]
NLYQKWLCTELHSKAEIGELIILEQLLRVLPFDSCTWLKEHKPVLKCPSIWPEHSTCK